MIEGMTMKRALMILGVIFVVLVIVGVLGIAIVAVKGNGLDKESKQYADTAIRASNLEPQRRREAFGAGIRRFHCRMQLQLEDSKPMTVQSKAPEYGALQTLRAVRLTQGK